MPIVLSKRRTITVLLLATAIGGGGAGVPLVRGAQAVETQTLSAVADTYTRADAPNTNYGTAVRFSTQGDAGYRRHAFVRFNVSIPSDRVVTSAKLRAYGESSSVTSGGVDLYTTSAGWTETGVTWNNAPSRGTWLGKRPVTPGAWTEWDVTNVVKPGASQLDVKLETADSGWRGFQAREASGTNEPRLVITTEAAATAAPPPGSGSSGDGVQAATQLAWGSPVAGDEFNYTGGPDPAKWSVYDSAGHAGNGLRKPGQIAVDGTKATISGTADGTTGGMAAKFDRRKYGRWEARMKVSERDPKYHPVLLLWPDSEKWPCDGEIDYAEGTGDPAVMNFFHHYSCDNRQTHARRTVDATQWHNYAVEWTDKGIVGYLDGAEWFRDTDPTHQPPGPMHQTVQLDWFPDGTATKPSTMDVDWIRVYDVPPAAPTAPPTGPPTADAVRIAAVGDQNPAGNVSTTSPSGKNGAAIAKGLADGTLDAFLGLGDYQYSTAYCADYVNYWRKLWGATKSKLYWVSAPNHDWEPGRNEDLDNFMNGQCPGDTTKSAINAERGFIGNGDPYSRDFGNWHVAFLSSALWRYDASRASQVTSWLDNDLAAAKAAGKHLAVVYHEPYFTSNTSSHTRATNHKPWIDVMWKHRVRLTLSGSQHNYERSCPVNNADQCVADGMTAFQVSTGGISLRSFTSSPSYITKRFSDTHGWLQLTLRADGSFDWKYNAVQGPSTDSGSRSAS